MDAELTEDLDNYNNFKTKVMKLANGILRSTTGTIGLIIILIAIITAVFAPIIATHDPAQTNAIDRLIPPFWSENGSFAHILGTDNLGRDVFSRIIYGSRI